MLFNSYSFILLFVPLVVMGFYALSPLTLRWRVYFLTLASLFFYAWWNPPFIFLLLGSILVNYGIGHWIGLSKKKQPLILGIVFNLGLIGYFKYAWFFLSQFFTIEDLQTEFTLASPILPLGISFFTFQQIAYLVDRYQGKVAEHSLPQYALFVSFFPQLVAGPIVHQQEILPQLTRKHVAINSRAIALGLACFIMGLSKKTILADPLGTIASPVFDQGAIHAFGFVESWVAALAYTLQLYFDFSGYSDMAIGLGLLFGIKIPLNFHSPYKARNIIEFWRRWHMTLSRFLRDYLYIPLGGNKKGGVRRYANLMTTMLLGGLWHGAGWSFIAWGGLHGLYLCLNHLWHKTGLKMPHFVSWLITFIAVVFAWVLFRAENLDVALAMWQAMLSPSLDMGEAPTLLGALHYLMIAAGLLIALWMPNTQQWLYGKAPFSKVAIIGRWQPTFLQSLAFGGLLWACLLLIQFNQGEFLYFNF